MKTTEFSVPNIDYIVISGVPVRQSKFGDILDYPPQKLECLVATAIIENNYAITGVEIKFFRSLLGLSLADFGKFFELSDVAILKWERKRTPLDLIKQIVLHNFMGEKLGIKPRVYSLQAEIRQTPSRRKVIHLKSLSSKTKSVARKAADSRNHHGTATQYGSSS